MADGFPLFLTLGALGITAMLPLFPIQDLGPTFFRMHTTIALVLVAVATILARPVFGGLPESPLGIIAQVSLLLFAVAVFVESLVVRAVRTRLPMGALLLPLVVGVPAIVFSAFIAVPHAGLGMKTLLSVHLLSSSALLGTALVSMTLGHWYLVNAALSFEHLIRMTRLLVVAALVKTAVSVGIYYVHDGAVLSLAFDFDALILGVRAGAGLLAVLAMGVMAFLCAKARSNQSATGILYVVVFFTIVGELCSMYLTLGQKGGAPA